MILGPYFDAYGGVQDVLMSINRTHDERVVRAVISHPEIKPLICDLEGEPPTIMHDQVYHLSVHIQGQLAGLVTFIPVNAITWNPHINIFPNFRGCGTGAMQAAIDWMFDNTPCLKLVAFPPEYNKAMIRVFQKCGFQDEGYSRKSFRFKGVIYDRLLLGMRKD